jgi:hypothetical protein
MKASPCFRNVQGIEDSCVESSLLMNLPGRSFILFNKQSRTGDSPLVEEIPGKHCEGLEAVSKASPNANTGGLRKIAHRDRGIADPKSMIGGLGKEL